MVLSPNQIKSSIEPCSTKIGGLPNQISPASVTLNTKSPQQQTPMRATSFLTDTRQTKKEADKIGGHLEAFGNIGGPPVDAACLDVAGLAVA